MTNSQRNKLTFSLHTALIIFLALVVIFAIISIWNYAYTVLSTREDVHTIAQVEEDNLHADTIIVLGASVYNDGRPSDILADRLEVAVDLYKAGASDSIIVSGDNRNDHYNESDAMKAYCIQLGVPADAIYVDHAGYDTYSSIYRAHYIYGAQSAFIVTQAYHLYRALAIASGLNMPSYGVPADKGKYNNQTYYSIREILARNKDMLYTLLGVPPEDTTSPIAL